MQAPRKRTTKVSLASNEIGKICISIRQNIEELAIIGQGVVALIGYASTLDNIIYYASEYGSLKGETFAIRPSKSFIDEFNLYIQTLKNLSF
mgnify:CR=1 FL=1